MVARSVCRAFDFRHGMPPAERRLIGTRILIILLEGERRMSDQKLVQCRYG